MDPLRSILHAVSALMYGVIFTIAFTNCTNDDMVLCTIIVFTFLAFVIDIIKFIADLYD